MPQNFKRDSLLQILLQALRKQFVMGPYKSDILDLVGSSGCLAEWCDVS
jgi:hypothetical protein